MGICSIAVIVFCRSTVNNNLRGASHSHRIAFLVDQLGHGQVQKVTTLLSKQLLWVVESAMAHEFSLTLHQLDAVVLFLLLSCRKVLLLL